MKKYISPITAGLTPDNWQDKVNPADLSLDEALDLLGDFKAMVAFGKKLEGFVKEVVKSKMPDDDEPEYTGTHWYVQVNHRTRKGGLDKEKITDEMGEDWVEEHSKPNTEYDELRLKAVEQ